MDYIYIARKDDKSVIADYKQNFESNTLEELVDDYNSQVRCGIVGVHQQALYLIAMRQEFKERLQDSPVHLMDYVLSLSGKIDVVDGKIVIREEQE